MFSTGHSFIYFVQSIFRVPTYFTYVKNNPVEILRSNSVSDETKFQRFLLYGSQNPIYFPGQRIKENFHLGENLESFRILLNSLGENVIFERLMWTHRRKFNAHVEIIPFVLSECCRIPALKEKALEFALDRLKTGEEFILFIKFSFEITPFLGNDPDVKNFIVRWYNRRHYLDIAEMLTDQPILHGWNHRRIMNMVELQSDDPRRAAVYEYAENGVIGVNRLFKDCAEAKNVVTYFNRIAKIRFTFDAYEAAMEISSYCHTVHNVNSKMLESKNVWRAILRHINLRDLLVRARHHSFHRLLRCNVLTGWDPHFVPHYCDRLEGTGAIIKSGITPSRSLIEQQAYQNKPKLDYKFARERNLRCRLVPRICRDIVNSFDVQIEKGLKLVKNVGLEGVIIIDAFRLNEFYCGGSHSFVLAFRAAAVLSLTLKRAGKNVQIVSFDGHKMIPFNADNPHDFSSSILINSSKKSNPNAVLRLISNPRKLSVVIGSSVNHLHYLPAVREFPESKFVFCNLTNYKTELHQDYENLLITNSFDENLSTIITAFALDKD